MTADQGRRLVSLCITCLEAADPQDGEDVLGGEMDQIRQLFNIDQSIVACGLDVIPAGASNVLRSHALRIAERCDGRTDVVGSIDFEMLGMIDIGSAQTQMNGLKPVTLSVARALLKGGQAAITGAIAGAKQPWYKSDLPGGTSRDNVKGHLQWHADALSKLSDPNAVYQSGDDLKKWTMQAYIEANAVEEGAAYLDQAWSQMWQEINTALAAIPQAVRQAAISAASGIVEGATGLPLWAWALILAGGAGLVGFVGYKVMTGPAGAAVVKKLL